MGYMTLDLNYNIASKKWYWGKSSSTQPQSEKIMEMGLQGWELISVVSVSDEGFTMYIYYYFKRPLA